MNLKQNDKVYKIFMETRKIPCPFCCGKSKFPIKGANGENKEVNCPKCQGTGTKAAYNSVFKIIEGFVAGVECGNGSSVVLHHITFPENRQHIYIEIKDDYKQYIFITKEEAQKELDRLKQEQRQQTIELIEELKRDIEEQAHVD